jgi:hypothetical protein
MVAGGKLDTAISQPSLTLLLASPAGYCQAGWLFTLLARRGSIEAQSLKYLPSSGDTGQSIPSASSETRFFRRTSIMSILWSPWNASGNGMADDKDAEHTYMGLPKLDHWKRDHVWLMGERSSLE